jgi:hypothetical protein
LFFDQFAYLPYQRPVSAFLLVAAGAAIHAMIRKCVFDKPRYTHQLECRQEPTPEPAIRKKQIKERIYQDEPLLALVAENSIDDGIILLGGIICCDIAHGVQARTPTAENTLSLAIIQYINNRRLFPKQNIIHINLLDAEAQGYSVADIEAIIDKDLSKNKASGVASQMVFIFDHFYSFPMLKTAVKLSKLGHTVIATANPHQSPLLSKSLENCLCFYAKNHHTEIAKDFFQYANLIAMRDTPEVYRSLDLNPKLSGTLIAMLSKPLMDVYLYMELKTTSPQKKPPLRF